MKEPTYYGEGDLGDLVAMLPSVRAIGRGRLIIGPMDMSAHHGRESLKGARYEAILPLLKASGYFSKIEWSDSPVKCDYDFSTFRHDAIPGENLAQWQARHLGVQISEDPWLTVPRSPISLGRVVIARTARYHDESFPWRSVVMKHPDCIFVGLPNEHRALEEWTREKIEYVSTQDLWQMAQIIAGADTLFANQTSAWWIGAAIGVRTVQETFAWSPNSRIERRNLSYTQHPNEMAEVRGMFRM